MRLRASLHASISGYTQDVDIERSAWLGEPGPATVTLRLGGDRVGDPSCAWTVLTPDEARAIAAVLVSHANGEHA